LLVTIVNACLRDGQGGSPTAVLEDASLTELERCQMPKLMGTSHAVFVSANDGDLHRPLASLRFFTATGELPGCGHGTVAALAFLAQTAGRDPYHVTLHASDRSLAAEATRTSGHVSAAFDPGDVQLRTATVDERVIVVDALGTIQALLCPGPVSPRLAGRGCWCRSPRRPPSRGYSQTIPGSATCAIISAFWAAMSIRFPTTEGRLSARMLAPSIGVPEDIANANSTACLAARLGQPRIDVDMGDSLGTPATITATAQQTRWGTQIRVGGAAKIIRTVRIERAELNRM
jgi:trans-2,3-dihydro-3-hydroxyanthranilate isomerase